MTYLLGSKKSMFGAEGSPIVESTSSHWASNVKWLSMQAVELTHANLQYQVDNLSYYLKVYPGERTLSLLPPWHIYERSCGYYILSQAAGQVLL